MSSFKHRYRPDCLFPQTFSLDNHIASADPHGQYLLRSEYIRNNNKGESISLTYVTDRNQLSQHTSVSDKSIAAICVIYQLDRSIDNLSLSLDTHRSRYTQDQAKYTHSIYDIQSDPTLGSLTDHLDADGKNLYAARTHTHTLAELNASEYGHNHDERYAPINHTHNYAPLVHHHPEYVLYSDLSEVGIYKNSVNVPEKILDSVGYTNDCNNVKYLRQGSFYMQASASYVPVEASSYFQSGISYYTKDELSEIYVPAIVPINEPIPTTETYYTKSGAGIVNGPAGVDSGFLVVRSSTDFSTPSGNIIQILYTDDMSWKRFISKEYNTTYENNIKYSFGKWLPLVETAPIGSLMFSNRNDVPMGYIEASGSKVSSKSYPLLYDFALNSGQIVAYENWSGRNDGCYSFAEDQIFTENYTITDSDKNNNVYVESIGVEGYNDYKFVHIDSSNITNFLGKTFRIFKKQYNNELVNFYLPNLGGNFLKMWASGSLDILGKNVEAGLPNITGYVHDWLNNFINTETHGRTADAIGGAFYTLPPDQDERPASQTTDPDRYTTGVLGFDASIGTTTVSGTTMDQTESPYGKSDTVTPKNISIRVFIKAYNGSLLHPDVTAETVTSIVRDELSRLSYATTDDSGLVKLATVGRIADPSTDNSSFPSVVTAKQLHDIDINNVKQISLNGVDYTPTSGVVTLPNLAEAYGNTIVIESDNQPLNCTAMLDIATSTNSYKDFVISRNISDINAVSVTTALKCLNASNALGYPVGSIVLNPICSQKPNNEIEYMSHPSVVVFKNNSNQVVVRLYWPLMWYIKRFTPQENDGSKTFPLITTDTESMTDEEIITAISRELSYWSIIVKVAL